MKTFGHLLLILFLLLLLAGCGGGGGGGSSSAIVSGVASKGIIRNGTIRIYALTADGSKGSLLLETTTDNSGAYRADIGSYRGPLLVEASGSYTDEATGATVEIAAAAPLRAAITAQSSSLTVSVTPLTELAVRKSEDPLTHRITVNAIETNNALISEIFRVDALGTLPVDALSAVDGTESQKEYALVLAAVAKLMQSRGTDLSTVLTSLKDAIGTDNRLDVTVAAELQTALVEFAASAANMTGITDISATPLINIGWGIKTLSIATTGATGQIAGIGTTITLPAGVTVNADASGAIASSVLTTSGAAQGLAILAGRYVPATDSLRATVRIAVVSATAFDVGGFATLTCNIAPDAVSIAAADFTVSELTVVDVNTNVIPAGIALTLSP
ncbi:MAG: hypothetical protein GJT30_14095 [Geobacter sp.]|nr:hypothetical protein [Geobacter sp.]